VARVKTAVIVKTAVNDRIAVIDKIVVIVNRLGTMVDHAIVGVADADVMVVKKDHKAMIVMVLTRTNQLATIQWKLPGTSIFVTRGMDFYASVDTCQLAKTHTSP
jgi:hypothetical protein